MFVTQLPGNDQVDEDSILRLMECASQDTILSTWRHNFYIRPLPKKIVSNMMHFVVHTLLYPQVKEFTSNFTVPLWLALKHVPSSSRHAFGLWLLYGASLEGLQLRQVPISLVAEYGTRPKSSAIRKWHRPADLLFFGLNFFALLKKSRRVNFKISN